MIEHSQGLVPGFTTRYRIFRLVYFEEFADIRDAIAREKEIKAWRREKKLWLIKRRNPAWQDLAAPLLETKKQIPHPRSQTAATGFGMTGSPLVARALQSPCWPRCHSE
jgi:hypothetical protein